MDTNGFVEVDDTFRLKMVDAMIAWISQHDDPRTPDVVAHYQGQREELVKRIQASNPPPVVVDVQLGRLTARGNGQ